MQTWLRCKYGCQKPRSMIISIDWNRTAGAITKHKRDGGVMSAGINIWNAAVDVHLEVFGFVYFYRGDLRSPMSIRTPGSRGRLCWAGALQRSSWWTNHLQTIASYFPGQRCTIRKWQFSLFTAGDPQIQCRFTFLCLNTLTGIKLSYSHYGTSNHRNWGGGEMKGG